MHKLATPRINAIASPLADIAQGRYRDDSADRREACSDQAFAASLSCISCMTIIQFLFRLHQPRNNRSNLIEDLVPAL